MRPEKRMLCTVALQEAEGVVEMRTQHRVNLVGCEGCADFSLGCSIILLDIATQYTTIRTFGDFQKSNIFQLLHVQTTNLR